MIQFRSPLASVAPDPCAPPALYLLHVPNVVPLYLVPCTSAHPRADSASTIVHDSLCLNVIQPSVHPLHRRRGDHPTSTEQRQRQRLTSPQMPPQQPSTHGPANLHQCTGPWSCAWPPVGSWLRLLVQCLDETHKLESDAGSRGAHIRPCREGSSFASGCVAARAFVPSS